MFYNTFTPATMTNGVINTEAIVRYRLKGETEIKEFRDTSDLVQRFVDETLRDVGQFDDKGKLVKLTKTGEADWFEQHHLPVFGLIRA